MTITPINRDAPPTADVTFLGFDTVEHEDFDSIAWVVEVKEPGRPSLQVACTMSPQEALSHAQQLLHLLDSQVGELAALARHAPR